jgi:hypothetical protein
MRPGKNWWAITPGYRDREMVRRPASRRFVRLQVRQLDGDIAETLVAMQAEIDALKRQLRQTRGSR